MSRTTGCGESIDEDDAAAAVERSFGDSAAPDSWLARLLGVIGNRPLVGVTAPSGQPPSIARAFRVDGETAIGDASAGVIGGDAGPLGTVSLRLGFRAESGRGEHPPGVDGLAMNGSGGGASE